MRASRLLLRQMTEPTGVPLPICIPSSPLNTGILERVGVIATFLATFTIFCEISERIFSRLRSNFTGSSPLCLCYFCYFHARCAVARQGKVMALFEALVPWLIGMEGLALALLPHGP